MSEYRAIEINSLSGQPFPVTVEYSVKDNVFCLYLTPISVTEIAELLPSKTFLLFNVDTNEFSETGIVTLSKVANDCSSFIRKFDDEILLMNKEQVIKLLNHVGHYNFSLIEVEDCIDVEKVIQVLELSDKFGDSTVIDKADSEVYLNSHDDCYLYMETKDKTLAEQLISLQIKVLVATVSNNSTAELNFDPRELIEKDQFTVVIPRTEKEEDGKVIWKILEGTFKDFVYEREMRDSGLRLILSGNEIGIEKVRRGDTPD